MTQFRVVDCIVLTVHVAGIPQSGTMPSKYTSKYTQCFFDANEVNWWKSLPESPDLNPIERHGGQ